MACECVEPRFRGLAVFDCETGRGGSAPHLNCGSRFASVSACNGSGRTPTPLENNSSLDNKKRLAVFDCDSTLIRQEIIDELGRLAGKEKEIAAITCEAMHGRIDYTEALRARVREFRGMPLEKIKSVAHGVEFRGNYLHALNELKKRGFALALITGSFSNVLEELKGIGMLEPFDFVFANELMIENGVATGEVHVRVGSGDKGRLLAKLQGELGILPRDTMAVGDGSTDIEMFKLARVSVAFNGKPVVRQAATHHVKGDDFSKILEIAGKEFAFGEKCLNNAVQQA